jgi:glycosyltransferase involved in cell wall biosynthesis
MTTRSEKPAKKATKKVKPEAQAAENMDGKPVLTVGLPLYNSENIAWLALESLCNQKNIDFAWELIIIQEGLGNLQPEQILNQYGERLKEVGCVNLQIDILPKKITLSEKWHKMGAIMALTSKVFVLQAGDCYSHENRLANTYKCFAKRESMDFYDERFGIFYHIYKRKTMLFDAAASAARTGLNMAYRADLFRKLPLKELPRNIDSWIFSTLTKEKGEALSRFRDETNDNFSGIDTDGYNNISKRDEAYEAPFIPFYRTNWMLNSKNPNNKNVNIPENVKKRLLEL